MKKKKARVMGMDKKIFEEGLKRGVGGIARYDGSAR